jgi:hypothetical protein
MSTASLVKSSTIVRHLIRRPHSSTSLTKSIDHTWFLARSFRYQQRTALHRHATATPVLLHLLTLAPQPKRRRSAASAVIRERLKGHPRWQRLCRYLD